MKKILFAAMIIALLAAHVSASDKSIGLTLAQIEANRKAMVEAMVAPTEQQEDAFWQTYWLYRGGRKVLTDRMLEVVTEFADAGASLDGSRSAALVLEVMDIEKRRAALKQEYVKKFQDILIPKQVVRWYQVERRMDSVIRADMALTIPFNSLASRTGGELTESEIRSDREGLVMGIVQPLEDQKKAFLYEYRLYVKKTDKLDERIAKLVEEYAESQTSLSDQQAERMLKEATEIDAARVKALDGLIYSLRADLTGKQMSRLMQCELKMNAVIDVALAAAIPVHQ
jgi:hypothetical protein